MSVISSPKGIAYIRRMLLEELSEDAGRATEVREVTARFVLKELVQAVEVVAGRKCKSIFMIAQGEINLHSPSKLLVLTFRRRF